MLSYNPSIYSFSVSDQSCKNIMHYFAKADDLSYKICELLYGELEIDIEQSGFFASRDKLLEGLELLVVLIKSASGHQFRLTKLQHFIDTVVMPASKDEEFYIHITSSTGP